MVGHELLEHDLQLLQRGEPVVGIPCHGTLDRPDQGGRGVGREVGQRGVHAPRRGGEGGLRAAGGDGQLTGERAVQQDAEGVGVAAGRVRLAVDGDRGVEVLGRADDVVGPRGPELRGAEVGQPRFVLGAEQHVGRLHVPMQHTRRVGTGEGRGQSRADIGHTRPRQRPVPCEHVLERPARGPGQHERDAAARVLEDIEQRHDGGVGQAGEQVGLTAQACQRVREDVRVRAQPLDRDDAPRAVALAAAVHDAVGASADDLEQDDLAQHLVVVRHAHLEPRRGGPHRPRGSLRDARRGPGGARRPHPTGRRLRSFGSMSCTSMHHHAQSSTTRGDEVEERTATAAPLVAWLVSLVVAIVAFSAMGGGQLAAPPLSHPGAWSDWAADRDAIVATVAVLRLLVLAMAWYLVGVTTVGAVARIARWTRLVRLADALSLPVVRRVLQTSLGVGLATTVAMSSTGVVPPRADGGPTLAAAAGQSIEDGPAMRPLAPAVDPAPSPTMTPLEQEASSGAPAPPGMRPLPATSAPSDPDPAPRPAHAGPAGRQADEVDLVTVVEGDHLWAIAERHLRDHRGHPVDDAEVAAYWVRLVEANRGRLVDPEDPDLVLPGQRFVLPELDADDGPA